MTRTIARRQIPLLIIGAFVALAIAGRSGVGAGTPVVWAPLPTATIFPIFLWLAVTGEAPALRWVAESVIPSLIGPFLLLVWYPALLRGASGVPRRSVVAVGLLSLLTLLDFGLEWRHGVRYHGEEYVRGIFALNLVAGVAAWGLMYAAKQRGTFIATLAAHVWVVGWIVWLAFPWLGELI